MDIALQMQHLTQDCLSPFYSQHINSLAKMWKLYMERKTCNIFFSTFHQTHGYNNIKRFKWDINCTKCVYGISINIYNRINHYKIFYCKASLLILQKDNVITSKYIYISTLWFLSIVLEPFYLI